MRGVPFVCWCRQQWCLALLLLTGYVTAIISFWVSLSSSSIPPYVIFQLASRLRSLLRLFAFTSSIFHIFFLVVDSSACVRSRLQFFTASAELLTKLCRNVENVVNVKRKIVLQKQVRNTTRKKERKRITSLLKRFTSSFFASTITFTPSILHVYVSHSRLQF